MTHIEQMLEQLSFSPITITSVALKKGKPDKLSLGAYSIESPDNASERLFTLDWTLRDLQRKRFVLEPGCIISDETGNYKCRAVHATLRPKYPVVIAELIS